MENYSQEKISEGLIKCAGKNNVPSKIIKKFDREENYHNILYKVLSEDERLLKLRKELSMNPCNLSEAVKHIFPAVTPDPEENLIALINLAVKAKPAKDAQHLLPANGRDEMQKHAAAAATIDAGRKVKVRGRPLWKAPFRNP